ncbi:MAG: Gfo/Idh/MocA family oxidoreductase [Planctomycetota bacterium]|nr:Gfo/Idh/MocA family oxidoreductase [Planctomycetota bacterium]
MLRLGIVDFDSSHSVEFARRFNRKTHDREQFVDGAEVVVAWPGSSEMAPERIPGFRSEIKSLEIPLVDSWQELIGQIDAVLILSLCGAAHLERVRPFLAAGIPAFVDKPFACSVADAREMIELAESNNVTMFNASGLRFAEEVLDVERNRKTFGTVQGAITYGPAKRADGNPGLFHYGIHSVEILFELLGTGCESVMTSCTDGAEVVTGRWSDGRLGTVRGSRSGATPYGFLAYCENGVLQRDVSTRFAYRNLCRKIIESFETETPAVSHESNLEVVQFVAASLESERRGGELVRLDAT